MTTPDLAAFLATEEGLTVARALLGLATASPAPARPSEASGPTPILEWRPVPGQDRTFERPDALPCKPRRVGPKAEGTLRVGLFGESMAAGFPLAPAYTPALVLQDLLRRALAGRAEVEVIDLALPNMGPTEQLRVAEAARQLGLDHYVLMGGNNWHYGLCVEPTASPDARLRYAGRIEEGGPAALAEAFRQQLHERARVMVRHLVAAAHEVGARPIVVIPPVNHAWERQSAPPWLGGGRTADWFEGLEAARLALEAGDLDAVAAAAEALEALDGALTGTPERLLARAHRAAGRAVEARDAARRAVHASNWHNHAFALPQVPEFVAGILRQGAATGGYDVIDLERVLAEHTGSPFLDLRCFYDHCHLSVEGVRVAMAAVAAQIAGLLLGVALPWRELVSQAPSPPTVVAASAALQAAHWASQFYPAYTERDLHDTLSVLLREAAETDEALPPVLRALTRLKSAACPPGLHGELPRAARVPGVSAALLSTRLNGPLLEAILGVLAEREDPELEALLDELVRGHDARAREGIDLAHPIYNDQHWERTPLSWSDPNERQGAPLYRAPWPRSRFSLLSGGAEPLSVELVARATAGGLARLRVNGALLGQAPLEARWSTWRGEIPAAMLRRGVNRVEIQWPALGRDDEARIDAARRRLQMGIEADLFPVFGEIYALRLRA